MPPLLRATSAILALAWMATIFVLSGRPGTLPEFFLFPGQDKLYHAVAYGLLGSLLLLSMRPRLGYGIGQMLLASLIATLYGISDEWHQSFVPGRTSDVLDVVSNGIGALLATGALLYISRRARLFQQA